MLTIILTALLSSALTLLGAGLTIKYLALPRIQNYIDNTLLPEAEQRVRAGVTAGVVDVLPKVKDNVKEGVSAALIDAASGGLLKRAPANIANNLESLTGLFFGKNRGKE